jgi:hypothetical protein
LSLDIELYSSYEWALNDTKVVGAVFVHAVIRLALCQDNVIDYIEFVIAVKGMTK